MMNERFIQVVDAVESIFAPRSPSDATTHWPDRVELGIHDDNLVEFSTRDYEMFAKWFDDHGDIEVLIVITNVHPTVDFSDFIAELSETLADDFEVDNPACEVGTPICVSFNLYSDDAASKTDIESRLRSLRSIADLVVREVTPQ
jgi:hypothetical protein